jgi:hypothetical protein
MATSTIPTFKAALLSRLQADAGMTGVTVTYGVPVGLTNVREWVMLGNTRPDDPTQGTFPGGQSTAAIGQKRREERYVLEVLVSVLRPVRESQQDVTERAFVIAGVIETSLRSWSTASPAFSGAGVRWALVTSVSHDENVGKQEREAAVRLDIACAERI